MSQSVLINLLCLVKLSTSISPCNISKTAMEAVVACTHCVPVFTTAVGFYGLPSLNASQVFPPDPPTSYKDFPPIAVQLKIRKTIPE